MEIVSVGDIGPVYALRTVTVQAMETAIETALRGLLKERSGFSASSAPDQLRASLRRLEFSGDQMLALEVVVTAVPPGSGRP